MLQKVAGSFDNFIGDRRAPQTWGQTIDLAHALNMEPEDLLNRKKGQAYNAEQAYAALKILDASAAMTTDLAKKARDTDLDEDVLAYTEAMSRHSLFQSQFSGITAEAGRTLNIFRKMRLEGRQRLQNLSEVAKSSTGKTLYQLRKEAKLVAEMDDTSKVSKFAVDERKRNFGDMILEYVINGWISGFSTHVTYIIGNSMLSAWRAGPETLTAAALGRLRAPGEERVLAGEAGRQFAALPGALPAAMASAAQAFREGVTLRLPGEKGYQATLLQPGQSAAPGMARTEASWSDAKEASFAILRGMRDAVSVGSNLLKAGGIAGEPTWGARYSNLGADPDVTFRGVGVLPIGSAIRLPSRFIGSIHTFFRVMIFSMEKSALAFRQAVEEGKTGADLEARVGELRQNPTDKIMQAATKTATELALMSSQGEFTKNLARLTNTPIFGIKFLRFIDPFVRISSNIIEQTIAQRTPLGILAPAIRADILGRNGSIAQDRAAARMMCGSALAMTFGGLAASGYASGSGPTDPRLAAVWRLAGNQAHSMRIGDMWYDMHRLGPLGMLMSTAADMYDVAHIAEGGDYLAAANSLWHGITQNILDESFMRGPSDFIKAVEDPGRYGEAYIRQWAGAFVPYSVAMSQMARASDPYSRQARTVMDEIKRRIPGLSEELLPRRDVWGEPLPNASALIAAGVTAIYEQRMSRDPVNLAMLALGIGPASLEREIRNVKLTDDQYDDYQRIAGRMAKMRLDVIVGSQQFASWPAHVQHDIMFETIRQSRETARGVMMMKYPSIPRSAVEAKMKKARGEK